MTNESVLALSGRSTSPLRSNIPRPSTTKLFPLVRNHVDSFAHKLHHQTAMVKAVDDAIGEVVCRCSGIQEAWPEVRIPLNVQGSLEPGRKKRIAKNAERLVLTERMT